MEEHGNDKSKPLVWLWEIGDGASYVGVGDGLEAAEVGELTVVHGTVEVEGCGIWTRPLYWLRCVLNARNGFHARDKTGAHVDEDVDGWAKHGVDLGMDFDGGRG